MKMNEQLTNYIEGKFPNRIEEYIHQLQSFKKLFEDIRGDIQQQANEQMSAANFEEVEESLAYMKEIHEVERTIEGMMEDVVQPTAQQANEGTASTVEYDEDYYDDDDGDDYGGHDYPSEEDVKDWGYSSLDDFWESYNDN